MDSGFGLNLEGFLVKGNLSLSSSDLPFVNGNGSIEGSGTLYINEIKEYQKNHGLTIQGIEIKDGSIYIPYTAASTEVTRGSIITEGGISIKNTENSVNTTSGGSLTTLGGAAIRKDLIVGGYLDVSGNVIKNVSLPYYGTDAANKDYVDSVASKLSGNFTAGQVIIGQDNGTEIKGYQNFTFDGNSLLVGGGANISIQSTIDSFGNKQGGNLVVGGNTSLGGSVDIGGTLNLHNNKITGVQNPTNNNDATTKEYVDNLISNTIGDNTNSGEIVFGTVGDIIISSPLLTWDNKTLSINSTGDYSLNVLGGVKIYGTIELNNQNIINLADPINEYDAVNKKTLNEVTNNVNQYEIVIGSTESNKLLSYPSLQYNGYTLTLSGGSNININTTVRSYNLTGNSSIITQGDVSIYKNLYVGELIDVNGGAIINVREPIDGSDVATKTYVDNNKLSGNFTTGQLIIAETNGDSIRGFDNLSFSTNGTIGTLLLNDATKIFIQNTTNATGLGIDGTLTSLGGASFLKNVYIGGQLDVNYNRITSVADPLDYYDAVNKAYVDSLLSTSVGGDNSLVLENNAITPIDIEEFIFDPTVRAFVCYIYVNYNYEKSAVYTIRGLKTDVNWYIVNTFVGDPTNVQFYIRKDVDGNGIIQYTNSNVAGFTSIQYRIFTQIYDTQSGPQLNYELQNNISTYTDINPLVFNDNEVDGFKLIIHVSNNTHTEDGFLFAHGVYKNGSWGYHSYTIGDISENISFQFEHNGSFGKLQYINTNLSDTYTLRIRKYIISNFQTSSIFLANTIVPAQTTIADFKLKKTQTNFNLMLYIEIPELNKYALYEIEAISKNFTWSINKRLIGDPLNINLYIESTDDENIIKYVNPYNYNAYVKYILNTPPTFQPLPVTKGGTGKTYLTPYAILRGNGTDAVIASSDFIYKDKTLILGTESSLLLRNETDAIGTGSGGSLTVLGGAAISKKLIMGDIIDCQDHNIINVKDPENLGDAVNKKYVDKLINDVLATSSAFVLENNISIAQNIPEFTFSSDTKAFISYVYVQQDSNKSAMFCLKGIKRQSNWFLTKTFIGNPTNIDFTIITTNEIGQVQYTNSNTAGVTSIKFRTITIIRDQPIDEQINLSISNNIETFTDILELTYDNTLYNSVQLLLYISNDTTNEYGMYILNCLRKGNEWILNHYSSGNVNNLFFQIKNENDKGTVQYINKNFIGTYNIRIQQIKILNEQSSITLSANTFIPEIVDETFLSFDRTQYIFHLIIYVEVPDLNLYALYDIEGLYNDGFWKINTQYIGDQVNVFFSIDTTTFGVLKFRNLNSHEAIIKYVVDSPLVTPLAVKKGGTGKTYIQPNAVLRGNGIDPILATTDFIYEDYKLKLGTPSSIELANTRDASSLTSGGTITTQGGAAIKKSLIVGEKLIVNNVDITPATGDISQKSFYATNNQNIPSDVTNFVFGNSVKSFIGMACVTIETMTETLDNLYELKGLKTSTSWILQYNTMGNNVGIDFNITNSGQIQYTSTNILDWISTTIKFRATTTTI